MVTSLLFFTGLLILVVGGEAMLRGSIGLGKHFQLPKLLIGIVIIGFGTSMPELVVSVGAVVQGFPGLAVGNVIGSNISNVLLILAASALIRPIGKPARILLPDGITAVTVSSMVVLLGMQGTIPAWQGAVMILALAGVITSEYLRAREEERLRKLLEPPVPLAREIPSRPIISALLALSGLLGMLYGAELLVDGATRAAKHWGVSEGLIGLTIVAVGSSLPELVSAVIASWRGHSEIAYGNVIGSNLFNLLGILGTASFFGPLTFPFVMVWLDGPVMIAATAAIIVFLMSGRGLSRVEAVLMICIYVTYVSLRYVYALN